MTVPGDVPPRVGRYETVIAIGSGGMATVYLARAPLADGVARLVALKLVHPHLRESEEAAATLIEEAKLAARIRHPNVVAVQEVGQDETGLFLVMDYVEGATLASLVHAAGERGAPIPPTIAARIVIDALAGLHAAHELTNADGTPVELVHRDFSPSNVLIGTDGVTRLTDFGIAKATSRHGATSTGVVKGKLGYLSPEQALGKKLDRRSDVWAAGVVIWELCAGRRLYATGDEPVATMMRIVSETPPRLSSVLPEVPPIIDQAVAMALTLDPSRRWPSAHELANALTTGWRQGGIAEREEVGAYVQTLLGVELAARRARLRALSPPPRAEPPTSRKKPLALGLGALAVIAVAALAYAASRPTPPDARVSPEPSPAGSVGHPQLEPSSASSSEERASAPSDAGPALKPRTDPVRSSRVRKKVDPSSTLGSNPYRKP